MAIITTPLAYPKIDKIPVPASEDPSQYIAASDWNTLCTVTDSIRANGGGGGGSVTTLIIIANDFAGGDLGAKINAADAYLGSASGDIYVLPGDYTVSTRILLSPNRGLQFGCGHITMAIADAIIFNSSNRIVGQGNGTVLVESSISGSAGKVVFLDAGSWGGGTYDSSNNGVTDVYFGNFQIAKGGAPDFDSAAPTLGLGNSRRVKVENIFFNQTSTIGVSIGGTSNKGFHAFDTFVTDCTFYQVASQNIGVVNAVRCHVNRNTFIDAGQVGGPGGSVYIDCEKTGAPADLLVGLEICNNIIDGTNGNGGHGIAVQGANGPITISGNLIYGGDISGSFNGIGDGILIDAVSSDVKVVGNYIFRCGQVGLGVSGCTRITVTDNTFELCGGGGNPAAAFGDTTYSTFARNIIRCTSDGSGGSQANTFWEQSGSDHNTVYGNEFDYYSGFVGGVYLSGANSREFDNVFGGYRARCFQADGTLENNVLVKRGTVAKSVAQFTTTDVASSLIGVCIGSGASTGFASIAVVVTDPSIPVPVKSDGVATIGIGSGLIPSTASAGRVAAGSVGLIGTNDGGAVAATADALCSTAMALFSASGANGSSLVLDFAECGRAYGTGDSAGSYTVGIQIVPTEASTATGVRFWWGVSGSFSIKGSIFNSSGTSLGSGTLSITGPGVFSVAFTSAVSLTPGNTYTIGVHDTAGTYFPLSISSGVPVFPAAIGPSMLAVASLYSAGDAAPVTAQTGPYPVSPIYTRP